MKGHLTTLAIVIVGVLAAGYINKKVLKGAA